MQFLYKERCFLESSRNNTAGHFLNAEKILFLDCAGNGGFCCRCICLYGVSCDADVRNEFLHGSQFQWPRKHGTGYQNNELAAEARIAETYKVLITSQPVTDAVSAKLNGAVSAAKLQDMISTDVQKNTMVLNVTVSDSDPQRAADVANAISEVAPQMLAKFPVGGTLYGIETAKVPKKPVSPNLTSNLMLGFILGLLLSSAIIILVAILDTTIWRSSMRRRSAT